MNKELLEIYTDYLISSFGQTTATGLSEILDNEISHDRITRFLSMSETGSKELWILVKKTVREVESEEAVLIFDDTIQEKAWTDDNEIITWHYDHCKNRTVKGVNILNCLYHSKGINIPVAFEIIRKTIWYCDLETRRETRKSEVTKNGLMREMIKICIHNNLIFRYIITDNWFSSTENMNYIKLDNQKDFVMSIKSNRTFALSEKDKNEGRFVRADSVEMEQGMIRTVYMKGVSWPLSFCRQVFINRDGSEGVLYLVSSDISITYDQITAIYKKRWNVEVFHKSVKSNAALAKSPTKTVRTQSNHFFASIYAFYKIEILKMKHNLNHFALRTKIYIKALRASFHEIRMLNA